MEDRRQRWELQGVRNFNEHIRHPESTSPGQATHQQRFTPTLSFPTSYEIIKKDAPPLHRFHIYQTDKYLRHLRSQVPKYVK
ncbi:hypothetical protein FH972_001115 [Carpinus fangiana]|uniref:Uncharacterized protein n=1 Tax=Carpinus fangiana TaxID=176857 RepID=A0A5N6QB32_9ROSI|nr:hypothetical protein FH972_001115 [Carpinus fangiana]